MELAGGAEKIAGLNGHGFGPGGPSWVASIRRIMEVMLNYGWRSGQSREPDVECTRKKLRHRNPPFPPKS